MENKRPFPIYAKSAFKKDELASKLKIGCDGVEYQLRVEDFTTGSGELSRKEIIEKMGDICPASAIHLPMENADIADDSAISKGRLATAMKLAELSARKKDRRVTVVAHIERTLEQISPGQLYLMDSDFESLFNQCPHVDIAVANVSPFVHFPDSSAISSGYYEAPVKFVERFKRYTDKGRLGVCLDVFHARITDFYLSKVFEAFGQKAFDTSLATYFEMYLPYMKLIRLASFTGNGYGKCHGAPFGNSSDDYVLLDEFLDLYAEYFPKKDCPVTLDIREESFLESPGYAQSLEMITMVSSLNA